MSHLGMKLIYPMLNRREDTWCERSFAPWIDMEKQLRDHDLPLFAIESMTPLCDFDFVGFTLQYEMSFTNIINMLDLGKIPIRSTDRTMEDPIVIAGGPCASNPEPLADFVDIFFIGDAEVTLDDLLDLYKAWKKTKKPRIDFLKKAVALDGIYVPAFYKPTYNTDGTLKDFQPIVEEAPQKVRKCFVDDLNTAYYPETLLVPYTSTVHDRVSYEIFRGCGRGCRFCQAGMLYRPTREKTSETIKNQIDVLLKNTGYDEISLASLSSGDYPGIETLIKDLVDQYESDNISVSLPSLRIDSVSIDMLEQMQKVRKSGVTLAPEAGTQRLRDVINKGVTEADLMQTVEDAFKKKFGHIKLYFMMGLPTETDEDIAGIAHLGHKVVEAYFDTDESLRNRSLKVVLSTACFVPKPFTPFQWEPQDTMDEFVRKQKHLKNEIKSRKITYNWQDSQLSYLEAIFARGDRRLCKLLEAAQKAGCRFDGWSRMFDYDTWLQLIEELEIDGAFYACRQREKEELFPWDFIDIGVTKEYLYHENQKAKLGELTPYCKEECNDCGVMQFQEGWVCSEHYTV